MQSEKVKRVIGITDNTPGIIFSKGATVKCSQVEVEVKAQVDLNQGQAIFSK